MLTFGTDANTTNLNRIDWPTITTIKVPYFSGYKAHRVIRRIKLNKTQISQNPLRKHVS